MTSTCRELLEQTKKLMDETQWFAPAGEDCGNVEGNFNELAARVEQVLALHGPPTESEAKRADLCLACGELWPCPTVRILDGEEP